MSNRNSELKSGREALGGFGFRWYFGGGAGAGAGCLFLFFFCLFCGAFWFCCTGCTWIFPPFEREGKTLGRMKGSTSLSSSIVIGSLACPLLGALLAMEKSFPADSARLLLEGSTYVLRFSMDHVKPPERTIPLCSPHSGPKWPE